MIKDNDSPRSAGRPTSLKYTCRCANMPGAYSEPLPGKQPRTRGGHERQGTQRGPAGRWREGRCRGRGPHGDHPPPPELGGGVADRLLLSAPAGDRSSARGSLHVRFSCSDGPTAPPGSPWVGTVLAGEPAARTGPARPRRPSGKPGWDASLQRQRGFPRILDRLQGGCGAAAGRAAHARACEWSSPLTRASRKQSASCLFGKGPSFRPVTAESCLRNVPL